MISKLLGLFSRKTGNEDAGQDVLPPEGSTQLILKDVHEAANGSRTAIEVRSDGIHLTTDGQEQLVPLSATGFQLSAIDEEIRLQIARKISLLVPALAESKKELLMKHVFKALFLLAEDQLPRVRTMIAEELRDSYNAPAELIRKLAWDESVKVSAPVLEFSPLLNDNDLVEIISQSDIPGVLEAITKRSKVSGDVSDAIVRNVMQSRVRNEDVRIITHLLENKGAVIREGALEAIIDEAPEHEIWHASLIERPELTVRTINKIARFVSEALILEMKEKGVISEELGRNLKLAVSSRLQNPHLDRERESDKLAIDMFTSGKLDAEAIMSAMEAGEKEFVISAVTLLAQVPKPVSKAIFASEDAKAVTALAWKAKLPVRVAIALQLKVAKIHFTQLLYAKEGERFPMEEKQMEKILETFLTKAA